VSRVHRVNRLIAAIMVTASALELHQVGATAITAAYSLSGDGALAQSSGPRSPVLPPPVDQVQTTYLRECMGTGAAAKKRRPYCECSYQQIRRRYTPQQYALLDGWIRSGPPELRRFAVVAWEPEFASCRPLLQTGTPSIAPKNRQPAVSP
jgi:hypothetical protein